MKEDIDINVARLDGYLSGVASLSGCIRGYSAYAYLIDRDGENTPIEKLIANYFCSQTTFIFESIEILSKGVKDLEREIQSYLVKNILGVPEDIFEPDVIINRRKYLSFVIMDLIDSIVSTGDKRLEVIRIIEKLKTTGTQSVFFCISLDYVFLVLQFNDNRLCNETGAKPE